MKSQLNNEENNVNQYPFINEEERHWGEIEFLDWYGLCKQYGYNANDKLGEKLVELYGDINTDEYDSVSVISKLHNFVVGKRQKLQDFLRGYMKASPRSFTDKIKLGDDGFWDLCSHIVGLGKFMYNFVYEHPDIILYLQYIKQENFEYGFDKAILDIQTKEES